MSDYCEMTVRLLEEGLLSLDEAAGANGVHGHPQTLLRWANRGLRGIKLESCLAGGRRMTSAAAFRRFIVAVQEPQEGSNDTDYRIGA